MNNLFLKNKYGKPVEGFLGEEPKAEILFLLKEPNTKDVKNDGFWFKECVENNEKSQCRSETIYINVLGSLADVILPQSTNSADRCKDILKSCAYMNLHPFSGEPSQSGKFTQTLKALKKLGKSEVDKTFLESVQIGDVYDKYYKDEKIEPKEVAINRLAIIDDLIRNHNCCYVITPGNIFYALHKALDGEKSPLNYWMEYEKNNKKFSFCYFEYNNTKILEFWHPAHTYISNELRDNFSDYINAAVLRTEKKGRS